MHNTLLTMEAELHSLWMQALEGQASSYARALTLMGHYLRRFFRKRMASQPSEVEDLVQETLIAIHQKRHTYHRDQPLTAWVYAIARYKWVDYWRAHGRREALHDDIDDWAEVLTVEAASLHSDAHADVGHLLEALPPKQREAITCTRLEGLSIAQTALRTGQSESAVKVNIHRGLKTLMARWKEQR